MVSPVSVNSSIPPQADDSSEWRTGERRDTDRRLQPTLPWIGMLGPLRRARGRRTSDQAGYVDRYSLREVALILTVFIMNVGDAFFTMLWLGRPPCPKGTGYTLVMAEGRNTQPADAPFRSSVRARTATHGGPP